jgi:F-type H+-transporting ATPase subunit b
MPGGTANIKRCIAIVLMLSGNLWAVAEAAQEAEQHGGGKVSIFAGNLAVAFWTVILFVVLLVVLGKWVWGPILETLKRREEYIKQSLEDAKKARDEAAEALRQQQKQLEESRAKSQEIISKGYAEALRLSEEFTHRADAEAARLREQAKQDIGQAKEQAIKEIYSHGVELATDLAGRILSRTLNPEDHHKLLQESINRLRDN